MNFLLPFIFTPLTVLNDYDSVSPTDPYNYLINPYVFFPCFKVICGENVGCFDPFLINGYLVSLPPLSGCPEVYRASTIRFLTLSRYQPNFFQSANIIKKRSRVALLTMGVFQEYDYLQYLILAQTLVKKEFDYVVLVDNSYLFDTYFFKRVIGGFFSIFQDQINTILVGRVVCNFIVHITREFRIKPKTIRVVGHSAGASLLSQLGEYCQTRYRLRIGHLVGKLNMPEMFMH